MPTAIVIVDEQLPAILECNRVIPLFGFGSSVAFMGLQVFPASSDQHSVIFPCLLRQRICKRPCPCCRIVGWMALNSFHH